MGGALEVDLGKGRGDAAGQRGQERVGLLQAGGETDKVAPLARLGGAVEGEEKVAGEVLEDSGVAQVRVHPLDERRRIAGEARRLRVGETIEEQGEALADLRQARRVAHRLGQLRRRRHQLPLQAEEDRGGADRGVRHDQQRHGGVDLGHHLPVQQGVVRLLPPQTAELLGHEGGVPVARRKPRHVRVRQVVVGVEGAGVVARVMAKEVGERRVDRLPAVAPCLVAPHRLRGEERQVACGAGEKVAGGVGRGAFHHRGIGRHRLHRGERRAQQGGRAGEIGALVAQGSEGCRAGAQVVLHRLAVEPAPASAQVAAPVVQQGGGGDDVARQQRGRVAGRVGKEGVDPRGKGVPAGAAGGEERVIQLRHQGGRGGLQGGPDPLPEEAEGRGVAVVLGEEVVLRVGGATEDLAGVVGEGAVVWGERLHRVGERSRRVERLFGEAAGEGGQGRQAGVAVRDQPLHRAELVHPGAPLAVAEGVAELDPGGGVGARPAGEVAAEAGGEGAGDRGTAAGRAARRAVAVMALALGCELSHGKAHAAEAGGAHPHGGRRFDRGLGEGEAGRALLGGHHHPGGQGGGDAAPLPGEGRGLAVAREPRLRLAGDGEPAPRRPRRRRIAPQGNREVVGGDRPGEARLQRREGVDPRHRRGRGERLRVAGHPLARHELARLQRLAGGEVETGAQHRHRRRRVEVGGEGGGGSRRPLGSTGQRREGGGKVMVAEAGEIGLGPEEVVAVEVVGGERDPVAAGGEPRSGLGVGERPLDHLPSGRHPLHRRAQGGEGGAVHHPRTLL